MDWSSERQCLLLVFVIHSTGSDPSPLPVSAYFFHATMQCPPTVAGMTCPLLDSGLTHVICFGRWDVYRWGANRRLKLARPLALALHASAFDVRRPCVDQPAASRRRVGRTWSTGRLADVPQPGTHVRDRTRPDCGTREKLMFIYVCL